MTYSSTILAENPSGFWQMHETNGTNVADSSGNGYDGTSSGGVTVNQTALLSALGVCYLFDGSSGIITLPNGARQAAPVTYEFWIKDNSISGNGIWFSANTTAIQSGWDVSDGNVVIIYGNGANFTTGTLTSGTIYYIAITVDGSMNFSGYYAKSTDSDVTALGSANPGGGTIQYGANTLYLGAANGSQLFWKGYMSNVAIYPSVLTSAKAKAHFLAGIGGGGPTTNTRTVTTSAALKTTTTRTVTTSAALQTTTTRTVTTSVALKTTPTRTIVTSASLQLTTPYNPPLSMPVISRGVPAFTNDDFSGSFPASNGNNSVYSDAWRCAATPAANANTGNLTTPVYLAYDLSGVNSSQRKSCVVVWYNDPQTGAYDHTISSSTPDNIPNAYTIDANAGAGGGSPPGSSWVTLATVTGNTYHSRQHAVDLTGYNWVRIRVTAIDGSTLNNNCALNMDVHDVHLGNYDNWIFYGDSISMQAFLHSDSTIPAQINALKPSFFPLIEDGGIGGTLSADGASHLSTWLPLFTGQYVGLLYGTNDANNAAAGDMNFGPTFITNMETMITAIIDAGKTPVIPRTICWGGTTNLLANVPVINTALAQLATSFPGIVVGPDLYTYFSNNQSLINASDHIHPTLPTGNAAYQTLWLNALASVIYGGTTFIQRKHKVGAVQ